MGAAEERWELGRRRQLVVWYEAVPELDETSGVLDKRWTRYRSDGIKMSERQTDDMADSNASWQKTEVAMPARRSVTQSQTSMLLDSHVDNTSFRNFPVETSSGNDDNETTGRLIPPIAEAFSASWRAFAVSRSGPRSRVGRST